MKPSIFPAHVLHARLSVACGAATGLLAGGGDSIVVALVGAFVLRAFDVELFLKTCENRKRLI